MSSKFRIHTFVVAGLLDAATVTDLILAVMSFPLYAVMPGNGQTGKKTVSQTRRWTVRRMDGRQMAEETDCWI